jgi:hypothetical protein
MAPALKFKGPDTPPSNSAQLGMGWNIATGTIDLGLALYDGLVLIGEWIHDYGKQRRREFKKADIIQRGKRPRTLHSRSIQNTTPIDQDLSYANWN